MKKPKRTTKHNLIFFDGYLRQGLGGDEIDKINMPIEKTLWLIDKKYGYTRRKRISK